ncbi:hypothetical protein [Streptomyces sp. GbtcB6]|uniref:hypothetical protein n=1 Tax=Streptomyces sp. GbtcB6 TaxID=2824751 RepID=UPI0027E52E34|nr:hypothetical protein [Streptomyces sp. GbtcB6]
MGTHTVRLGIGAAVIAVMTTVSACGGNSKPCAGVGVESGVGVMFLQEGYTDLDGASYELCARGKCVKGELEREDITRVSLPLPDDVDPETGTVRFRVTPEGSRRPEIDASSAVRLTHQSDGCGGGAYSRGLAFTKEAGLTTRIPPSVSAAWRHRLRALASPSGSP